MKELEDNQWFPAQLRRFQTEYIGFVVSRFNIYKPLTEHLKKESKLPPRMFDLCSGSGEPALSIYKDVNRFESLLLSDKFPITLVSANTSVKYLNEPLDALSVTFQPDRYYTMFNAFHHFSDTDKKNMLERMIWNQCNGCFAEILSPTFYSAIKVLFATTIGTIFLTPFIRPFKWSRIFFTYILPVNILTITIDGIISVFKSGSVKHYRSLFKSFGEQVKVFPLRQGFRSLIIIQVHS